METACQYLRIDTTSPIPHAWSMCEKKTTQLQIRISPSQKAEIVGRARAAGMSVSAWLLAKLQPSKRETFQELLADLVRDESTSQTLAAVSDFIGAVDRAEFEVALGDPPYAPLSPWQLAYVASMIEHTAYRKKAAIPAWAREVPPLGTPYFASELLSLRLHLLTHSPSAFRRRNIFVDSAVGDRV